MRTSLDNISPIDGRYQEITTKLAEISSEKALIHNRIIAEISWLEALSANPDINCPPIKCSTKKAFAKLKTKLTNAEAKIVKTIEMATIHDVKAIEYFLRELVAKHDNADLIPWLHFACTSEDINNTAYALMLTNIKKQVLLPELIHITLVLCELAQTNADKVMLGWTHGQPASPTTLGKELLVFAHRLLPVIKKIQDHQISAKFNGAVGNHNAHLAAYPEINWPKLAKQMLFSLGLEYNPISTQICNHDSLVALVSLYKQAMLILLDLCQDIWLYSHKNYLQMRKENQSQVGSSTMPHKINPIDFENAEGNIGLHKAIANQLIEKLPISRLQRDLSDSTTLRNIGSCFAYAQIANKSLIKGLGKISANTKVMQEELNSHWEVLTEAVQTIMRKHGYADAYEQLKQHSQGSNLSQIEFTKLLTRLDLPEAIKYEIAQLSPNNFTGNAEQITLSMAASIKLTLNEIMADC